MTVLRNSLARCNARHLRIKRLVQFIFADPIYHNALTNCAARLCRALCRVAHMCSSTVFDTANMLRNIRKKNPLPYSNFGAVAGLWSAPDSLRERGDTQEGGHSFNPRTAREKGLAAYGQTAGVYPLVRPRGVSAHFVRFSSGDYI